MGDILVNYFQIIELWRLFKLLLLIELNDCLEFWILFKSKIFGYISSK